MLRNSQLIHYETAYTSISTSAFLSVIGCFLYLCLKKNVFVAIFNLQDRDFVKNQTLSNTYHAKHLMFAHNVANLLQDNQVSLHMSRKCIVVLQINRLYLLKKCQTIFKQMQP